MFRNVEWANLMAFNSYTPITHPDALHVFLSKEVTENYSDDPQRDLSNLATGKIDIHMVDDDGTIMGASMFKEPYVRELSKALTTCLNETQAKTKQVVESST